MWAPTQRIRMNKTILTFAISTVLLYGAHWDYEDNGPSVWGDLDKEWEICKNGLRQSPVNINTDDDFESSGRSLEFSYFFPSSGVIYNGHSLQVNFNNDNFVTFGKTKYNLLQFHFHTPSENTIDGKQFPLEVDFVHRSANQKLLVISVLFEEGRYNDAIQDISTLLPLEVNEQKNVKIMIYPPKDSDYYFFDGSLTTPPCSEEVQWIIMKERLSASKKQIDTIKKIIGKNARETQPLNGRTIYISK